MHTEADRTADALRLTLADLDAVIGKIRGLHERGKPAPKAAARYASYVRSIAELTAEACAAGADVSSFEELSPIPYRNQLVGLTADQRRKAEWRGVSDWLRTSNVSETVAHFERIAA